MVLFRTNGFYYLNYLLKWSIAKYKRLKTNKYQHLGMDDYNSILNPVSRLKFNGFFL